MNYSLLKTLAVWLAMLFTANMSAQSGAWTLGLNGGAAYQQSDVCALPGWGTGLTLGKNIYHRPNGLVDVDLRGRYLYTHTRGANHFRTGDISKNTLLNGTTGGVDSYVTTPGYVFQNHVTDIHEGSGELVFTANRLRQKTGIELGVFGGIGLDFHQARTDQENSFRGDSNYDYASIDTDGSRRFVLNQLNAMQDGSAWNNADGYADGFRVSIMPSAGLELGYAVTPWFSIGAGHRATWALDDYIDGEAYNPLENAVFDNDVYHYTDLFLRWKIKGKKTDEVIYDETVETMNPTEETVYSGPPPTIRIVRPNTNPAMVDTRKITFIAHVKNVKDKRNINVTQDNRDISFTFDKSTGKLVSNLTLRPGKNIVEVYASNEYGRDEKGKTIIYEEKEIPTTSTPVNPSNPGTYTYPPTSTEQPPLVDIYTPSSSPYETTNTRVRIRARVKNIDRKDQIQFILNNQYFTGFNFNPNTDLFEATVNMTVQQINVQIKAINTVGEASDFTSLVLKGTPEPQGPMCDPMGGSGEPVGTPPTVKITNPAVNPYSTTKATATVTARIREVTRKSDVTFLVNGTKNTNFSFNSSTGVFNSTIGLNKGNNVINITGRNNYGTDRDAVTIKYSTPITIKPTVKITTPVNNPYTSTTVSTPLKATVTGVKDKSEIRITVNNNPIRNFTYSRNVVSTTVNLISGNNNVVVSASNSNGSDSDTRTIKYSVAKPPPTVTITTPSTKTTTYKVKTAEIVAKITNITAASQIRYMVDGRTKTNFSFSTKSGLFKSTVALGNTPVRIDIIATNSAGTDRDDRILKYELKLEPAALPPGVNIYKPERDITVTTKTYEVEASVTGVTTKRQISVRNNGNNLSIFTYDPRRNIVKVTVQLSSRNNIVITAGNEVGRASDNVNITYRPKTKVTIQTGGQTTDPDTADPPTTGGGSWPTTGGGGVTVDPDPADPPTTGGGSWPTTGGGGTPRTATPKTNLGKGGTTKSGVATGGTKQPTARPSIRINAPGDLSFIASTSTPISGVAKYVDGARALTVKVNGRVVPGVKFDPSTGNFNTTVKLANGKNRIEVSGMNALGTGIKKTTLYHSSERTRPVIFGMGNTSQTVRKSQKRIKAIVANVDKSNIQVLVNGVPVKSFNYGTRTKLLSADVPMKTGTNKVEVIAKTRSGQASQVWTFTKR